MNGLYYNTIVSRSFKLWISFLKTWIEYFIKYFICVKHSRWAKFWVKPTLHFTRHNNKDVNNGIVSTIDNRKLAKIAKLAGAPENKAAGVDFLAPIGTLLEKGQTMYVIHAESKGELNYALDYYRSQQSIVMIKWTL